MDWYEGIEIAKDPDANLDYEVDWTTWLDSGDSISSHDVDAGGLTLGTNTNDGNAVTFWVSGGTVSTSYTVRVRVTTVQGRIDDRSVVFVVGEK